MSRHGINNPNYRHGKARTKEYRIWLGMRHRCLNKNSKIYKYYGARNIKICKRWNNFKNFIYDIGLCPSSNHSLDRINNNGDYKPSNCRWATKLEQSHNRRTNILIKINGISKPLRQWCIEKNHSYCCVRSRIRRGWRLSDIFKDNKNSKFGKYSNASN